MNSLQPNHDAEAQHRVLWSDTVLLQDTMMLVCKHDALWHDLRPHCHSAQADDHADGA